MKVEFKIENGMDSDVLTWDSKTLSVTHSRGLKVVVDVTADECNCLYCGEPNGSTDEDLLCDSCRESFGHSKFSEL